MPDLIDRAIAWVKSPTYIDFTTRQLAVLGVVLAEPQPVKVKDLAATLAVSKPVITRAVGVLVKHRLVERQKGRDLRNCFIAPTEAGRLFRSLFAESE
ncbi:MarR family transcriptional regulator [Sphingobium sufflavum]|uniref:MarR family transcriptional regulator n=1 Tax=Sphingobium sufflavum TaxID=1129547 RepID=UPI001F446729|nr:MarR family transcriptional regulator [Sphingobium sufflavum]MCE7797888.1 MarR family transcriptional regulator [Sphingobium sufflavum]